MNKATTLILLTALSLASCRGMESDQPPIHPNLNMDFQERFDPQEANPFFADNRSMRPPVPGTIARGRLGTDSEFYEGRTPDGGYVDRLPVPTTRELLERGRNRYDIFCEPCHGGAGDGEGIITTGGFGYTPAPTYHSDRLRNESDGYLYDTITNGIRTMPPYAHQIPPADRWAIVAYVRALQRSQYADPEDVPASIRAEVQASRPADVGVDEPSENGEPAQGEGVDQPNGAEESGAQEGADTTAAEGDE